MSSALIVVILQVCTAGLGLASQLALSVALLRQPEVRGSHRAWSLIPPLTVVYGWKHRHRLKSVLWVLCVGSYLALYAVTLNE